MTVLSYIIWIGQDIDNTKKIQYFKEFESVGHYKHKMFSNIEEALNEIKSIEFVETIIIINGKLYIKFIEQFQQNIKKISIIPQIIIFADNKEEFIKSNKDCQSIIDH